MQSTKSTRELALDFNKSQSTIWRHLKKIEKVSKLGVWNPHKLREKNKEDRISIVTSFLSIQRNDPFFKNIMTDDEKWVFYDNVQWKRQWIDLDEPLQPIPKAELHERKVMLCV